MFDKDSEDTMKKCYVSKRVYGIKLSGVRRILQMTSGTKDVISFAVGQPDFDTPINIREAGIRAIKDGYTKYISVSGILELREAIADKLLKKNKIVADPESEILVTVGSASGLYCGIQAVIDGGDNVLMSNPGYTYYPSLVKLASGRCKFYKLKEEREFRPDPEEIECLVDAKTKLIMLNSPNNPLGSVLTKDDLKSIADICKRHDLLVMTDEAYEDFIYDGYHHCSIASLPGMKERTISVFTLSKTYSMTGWRVGYVAAPKTLMESIRVVQAYVLTHPSSMVEKAAVEALLGPQENVLQMREEFQRRRDFMVKRLLEIEGVSCVPPRGAFYAFPDMSFFGRTSWELAEHLLKNGRVLTVPGLAYGSEGEGHLRLSFSTSIQKIEEGLDRLERTLRSLHN